MGSVLFHNPAAGNGGYSREDLLRLCSAHDISPRCCSVLSKNFKQMLAEPADLTIVAGGDGTIATVLSGLSPRETPVALLPVGETNNVALSFGLEGDLDEQVAGWRTHSLRGLDIGRIQGISGERAFVGSVGFGTLAETALRMHEASDAPENRVMQERAALRDLLKVEQPVELTLDIDGEPQPGNWIAVEIMNVPVVGPRLRLSDAEPSDGMLDVVVIDEADRDDLLDWLDVPDRLPPPVPSIRASTVRFDRHGLPALRIDDEIVAASEDERGEVAVGLSGVRFSILAPP